MVPCCNYFRRIKSCLYLKSSSQNVGCITSDKFLL